MGAPRIQFWRGLAALSAVTLVLTGCSLLDGLGGGDSASDEAQSKTHVCDPINQAALHGYADQLGLTGPTHTQLQTIGTTMPMMQTIPTCAVQMTRDQNGPTLRWGVRDPEITPNPTLETGFEELVAASSDTENLELPVQQHATEDAADSDETTEILADALGFKTRGEDGSLYGVALAFEADGLEYVTMAHRLPADIDRAATQKVVTDIAEQVLQKIAGTAPERVALDDRCPAIDGSLGEYFSVESMNAQSGWLTRENQISCFYSDESSTLELGIMLPVEHARFPETESPFGGWSFMLEGDHGVVLRSWEGQPGIVMIETQIDDRCVMSATVLQTGSALLDDGPVDPELAVTALQTTADSALCAPPNEESSGTTDTTEP